MGQVAKWCWLRCRLQVEHFGLDRSCDLNPATSRGLLHQTHISLLLGCMEVVVEDIVAQATGPDGEDTAAETGQQLIRAFELHQRLFALAKDGKSAKAAAGASASSQAPAAVGQKRGRGSEQPCASFLIEVLIWIVDCWESLKISGHTGCYRRIAQPPKDMCVRTSAEQG